MLHCFLVKFCPTFGLSRAGAYITHY
jgi:hypothetical protein